MERPVSTRFDASAPAEVAQWVAEAVAYRLYAPSTARNQAYRGWLSPRMSIDSLTAGLDDAMYAVEEALLADSYPDLALAALDVAAWAAKLADRATMLAQNQQEREDLTAL